jgi:myo-inositol 2-dehydrogenase/D-chiro-inositol 1-dehydrogenase
MSPYATLSSIDTAELPATLAAVEVWEGAMRIAVVGTGRIGQLHGTLMASQPDVSVVLSDVDRERASALAHQIGADVAPSPDAALDQADGVIIAASTNAHAGLVRAAVDRRLPTFCEKPLALELEETIEVVEHVERSGVPVQIGLQRRFDPAYVDARRRVESGALGTVYLVRLIAHDHTPPPDDYIPISGGLFRDSAIHDFDSIRWMTGREVVEVYATGSVRGFPVFAQHDDVDTGAAVLRLDDGTLGVLGQSRHNPLGYDIRMEIVGSLDSVSLGLTGRTPIHPLDADAPQSPAPVGTASSIGSRMPIAPSCSRSCAWLAARRPARAPPAMRWRRCASPWRPITPAPTAVWSTLTRFRVAPPDQRREVLPPPSLDAAIPRLSVSENLRRLIQ